MRQPTQFQCLFILVLYLLLGTACKKTIYGPSDEPITYVAPQFQTPKNEVDCTDLSTIPDSFFLADLTPEIQANGCSGMDYPIWQNSPYVLPYPVSTGYKVNLNNCSNSYHAAGEPDALATDFNMTIGTCISAARAGKVIHVEESGFDGGFPNNLVVIRHEDATFAQYMHLTKDGAEVEVGDEVEQGDFIGLSGATGLAGYPHLHFIVTKNDWKYPYQGVPVTFSNTYANEKGLQTDRTYYAFSY